MKNFRNLSEAQISQIRKGDHTTQATELTYAMCYKKHLRDKPLQFPTANPIRRNTKSGSFEI